MLLSCHTHSQQTLHEIASYLHLAPSSPPCTTFTRQLLLEILVSHHERRPSQLEAINALPLYPTEQILWDENIVPSEFYNGESKGERCVQTQYIISLTIVSPHLPISACLALPKLNLQFLTLHDYLLRNFELFRLESTCEPTPLTYSRHTCHSLTCILSKLALLFSDEIREDVEDIVSRMKPW